MEAIRTSIREKLNFVQNSVFSLCSATSEPGNKERYINLAGSPQSIGGQSRFTIANDGEKDCLALLITREMIDKIQINVNLMGIELYNSFELRVSPEAIQDVDLLSYDDVLEHQDWDEDHSESMFSAQSVQTELTPEELYGREVHDRYNETSWALCHARENYTDSSGSEDNNTSPEADVWDAEPVRVLDSLSVIDRENYGKTTRRWRKLGEAQRGLMCRKRTRGIFRRHSWNDH